MTTHRGSHTGSGRGWTRRAFLRSGAAALAAAPLTPLGVGSARAARPSGWIVAPEHDEENERFGIGVLDLEGGGYRHVPTDLLGHSLVGHPVHRDRAVLFGQRPGRRSCLVDLRAGEVLRTFESAPMRHFYGHGGFTPDGKLLLATENDYRSGEGVISVRDGETLEAIGDFPSHGIGPHDVRWLEEGKTVVVANGGVRKTVSDPKSRVVEDATLVYVDAASGKLLSKERVARKDASIRHLVVTPDNDVVLLMQYYERGARGPTVALRSKGGELRLMDRPASVLLRCVPAGLSACIHEPSGNVGVTHPEKGFVTFWSLTETRYLSALRIREAEGITLTGDGEHFLVTTRTGEMQLVDAVTRQRVEGSAWNARGLNWKHSTTWIAGA